MHWLHAAALLPAGVAAACAARRPAGGGRTVAVATGLIMVLAMADVALLPGGLPSLVWAAVLLVAGVAAALAGRAVDDACHPLHLLHVMCLLTMGVLTAAMASPTAGTALTAGLAAGHGHGGHGHGGHGAGGDPLTGLALAGAAAFVGASVLVAARTRRSPGARDGTLARAEILAGAGSVALMALAAL
ncbi:conserved hypothetical protein [Xylanimonas cellulosilytica DSM 15894]|uniref:DUF5134 domain-containing protein n=1 Tax=Xylanimonas cellulosilytica (strain DSM 15894 / JCM 12276 / CECT 5975 / KCTC 9989 / LMG 20990 / NBRC 107835 / XIL07) TaxID=446471 RepID=D1BZT9_XYLCX|nr:hypothetical protein [Xylanimonas cellulosilytica]ACZ32067.1 conserved hypothetical protein [Xylanimonas cellulosilytica DSM 15894]